MSAVPSVNGAAPWPHVEMVARTSVAAPDHPPVFSLDGVGVRYGLVQALQGVHLSVAPGERVALIGANGCGKSTLLRVLHGLAKPSSGQLLRGDGSRQAMLFQRPHMLRMSAQHNVALGLWLHGVRWREARAQALLALQRVGLDGIAAQNARTLSGGQQQRVALARAWALRPDVLLLDEPTASATRCCWPPESVRAFCCATACKPTRCNAASACNLASRQAVPRSHSPSTMLFCTLVRSMCGR